jgi:hypothetical protein
MKSFRGLSSSLILPSLISALFLFFSGSAMANIGYPSLSEWAFIMAAIIFVVYVPVNLLLYMGFLCPVLWFKSMSDDSVFEPPPSYYLLSSLGTVLFTSYVSGFTDALLFYPMGYSMFSMLAVKVVAIFLCFFFLSMAFHKPGFVSAIVIALSIALINVFLWFMIFLLFRGVMVLAVLDLIIILVILPCLYYWYREKHEKTVYGSEPF